MLQTRSGRCPNCKEEILPGAEVCPLCGLRLTWEGGQLASNGAPGKASRSTPARETRNEAVRETAPLRAVKSAPPFLRLFLLFVGACVISMAAVSYRKNANKNADAPPNLIANHAILVQDAEAFRDGIKAATGNTDAPEAAFVIGVAQPNNSEVLEITVKNEWKSLDYPTRLNYAAKLVERWKAICAPHRANLTILDEAGTEIGGRTWNGTVWAQEKHDDAPAAKPTATLPGPEVTPIPPSTQNQTADGSESTPGNPSDNNPSNANAPNENTPSENTPNTNASNAVSPPAEPPTADALSNIPNQ